ncbi:hypothetical protein ACFE04_020490 [Oxalis oulophora]
MAENMSISLLHVMDHLWFHQVILVPDPISLLITKTSTKTPSQLLSDSQTTSCSSLFSSASTIEEDTTFEEENSSPPNEEDTLDHLVEEENSYLPLTPQEESNNEEKERPAREKNSIPNYMRIRTRSHSMSPSFHKRSTKHCSKNKILEKSMSCRTFGELELEELKGFMDLGFTFKKEEISPKLMILIPGLHRLSLLKNLTRFAANDDHNEIITKDDNEVMSEEEYNIEDEESIAMNDKKPYLSEAWLIKRPDSPLLNLRVPRFSAASDMKKHLKSWARIVASEIHQET